MRGTKDFRPMDMKAYLIDDRFWKNKMEVVRTKMIPYQWKALNDLVEDAAPSHCVKNFRIAAGMEKGDFQGCVFQDSDLAKWLERQGIGADGGRGHCGHRESAAAGRVS